MNDRARKLADGKVELIRQHDIFYRGLLDDSHRLKLRKFSNGSGELIWYARPNDSGPKLSQYLIAPVPDADKLDNVLRLSYGVLGEVKKDRFLYLVGRTRVHLDKVADLGEFMELEVVLDPSHSVEFGEEVAHQLMENLGIAKEDLVKGAYLDLVVQSRNSSRQRGF